MIEHFAIDKCETIVILLLMPCEQIQFHEIDPARTAKARKAGCARPVKSMSTYRDFPTYHAWMHANCAEPPVVAGVSPRPSPCKSFERVLKHIQELRAQARKRRNKCRKNGLTY